MIQLEAIGLVVADIPKSVGFYGLLGVPHPEDMEGPHVESNLLNGVRLMWDSVESMIQNHPGWTKPVGQQIALAFLCGSPGEVDATHDAVVGAGFASAAAPWDAFWGQRYAQVTDPDGNSVDIFAWLPHGSQS